MLFRLRALIIALVTALFVPLFLMSGLTIIFVNLVYVLTGFARKRPASNDPPRSELASILILNWNGKDLLARGLPSVIEAVRVDGHAHEILVVDNGSTDGSVDYVRTHFPEVRLLTLPKNLGFAEGNNAGVRAAQHDTVVLLNNDMVVDPGFLAPLLKGLGPDTFAVSSQIYLQDPSKRREETGKTTAAFRRGMIDFAHRPMGKPPYPRSYYPVFWAGGGSSAFNRDKFLSIGGFQSLYSPAYVEDTDLSFQAWKAGWEVLLAPDSIVYHLHRASSNRRFSPSQLQSLILRNQFLFLWKNVSGWRLLLLHMLLLPWNCYRLVRDHGAAALSGFLRAVVALPAASKAKLCSSIGPARSDLEIFELFAKPGLYFSRQLPHRPLPPGAKPNVLWITAYLPHSGRHAGAGRMIELLKRLSSKYRITLISFLETDEERNFLPQAERFCREVLAFRRSRPAHWQPFAYEPFDEFLTPEMKQTVDCCLEDNDFDLIQLEYTQMGVYAKRSEGIPTVLTKHEVDFAACARRAQRESDPATKLRWFYNYLQVLDREISLAKNIDALVCMTDPDAQELKKFAPSAPVYTINTGVDLDYFRPPRQQASDGLVFVGAFQHLPNVEAMLYFCREVLPRIQDEMDGVELWIVGSNPPPPVLSLGALPGVHVTGYVQDIRPYMENSSVYIVPLRLGVGIRGKILEAWSMGMPVVTTSVGCAGLRYKSGENLLIADTPDSFAEQVISLLKNPALRQRLGTQGRRTVEQYYSWDASAQRLDKLYQKLLSGRLSGREKESRGMQGRV